MLRPIPIEPVLRVSELYTLYFFHHKSGYRFAGESHNFWEIIYVDQGKASGLNGPEPYTLEKGQVIFHHPNVFHNFRTGDASTDGEGGEDCDIIVISFNGQLEMLESFSGHIFTLSMHERRLFKEILEEGLQAYGKPFGKNLVYQKQDPDAPELLPGAKQMIANLLEQLLISLYRKQKECPSQVQSLPMQSLGAEYRTVRQIVLFLDQNIYNNISFTDVASHFNLSETQLKKIFREVTGYSVMQYYRKSVVGRIEYHIRQMDKNFTELADLFNFSSIHYFSKFYKRETGHTLREYLKSSLETAPGRGPDAAP